VLPVLPTSPLFPGRLNRHRASELGRNFGDPVDMLDWEHPIVCEFVYETNFKPALQALEFPSARWHDLRHSFAVMSLSSGEHYMQVSKWLGHAMFTLTLDTYGDYISSAEGGKAAPLARPVAVAPKPKAADNVVPINRQAN
jgi:integrase